MRQPSLPAVVLLFAVVAVPNQAHAQDLTPYVVMAAGNVADLWTTQSAIDRGAVEANPILGGASRTTLAVAKLGGTAAFAVLMRVLETHGHPRMAHWFGYVNGAASFALAAHNLRVQR